MKDDLVVLDGSTFFVSDPRGDADGDGANGYFFRDMRHLSRWQLLVDGSPLYLLTSRIMDYYSARVFGTLAGARVGVNPTITVQRDRIIAGGVHEDIHVENHSNAARRISVELRFAADFADLFEIKDRSEKRGRTWAEPGDGMVTLWYERQGFKRGTRIWLAAPGARCGDDHTRFELVLAPRANWQTCIDIVCFTDEGEAPSRARHGAIGKLEPQMPQTVQEWLDAAPLLTTTADSLVHTYRRTLLDIAALRFRARSDLEWTLPAAGLPWFMALFGRDSILTSYAMLPFDAHLAATTLETLAGLQAKEYDDFRDAEPGKILHELRLGELSTLGETPHSPYYGTHDATALFLVLLDEYERWTGDVALVKRLEQAARAALAWIRGPGDPDGDGYLEYQTRSPKGLVNQCWKDSWNSILFADGRLAEPPIASCEIQGYAYDARVRCARLARECWNDPALASALETEASELHARFNRDYWNDERGHYVLALDASKGQVDALTSNVGHLLWSGIVDADRAAAVASRIMSPELFSGWGVRTMSTLDAGYNPIEYHNGTVWPHDTAIVAEGLRRYGFRTEATTLANAIIEAAAEFDHRLPEVFAGLGRGSTQSAVEYPTASRPQAWAATAPLMAIRTLLGLDAVNGELRSQAVLPPSIRELEVRGLLFRGARVDVR
jgi:glycogen debranching enzyme